MNEGHSPRDNRTRYEDREASDDTLVSSTLTTIDADKLQALMTVLTLNIEKLIENNLIIKSC